jgi:uncharacterized protein (DUF488 family)
MADSSVSSNTPCSGLGVALDRLDAIVTIGVYGFDKERFFEALRDADVDTVCDVRARRGTRGPLYAFANSARLQESLRTRGCAYVHAKHLAPSLEARRAQAETDKTLGDAKRKRTSLSESFLDTYRRETLGALSALDVVEVLPEVARIPAFLCVEQHPEACHRGALAEWLAETLGAPVKHLLP